MQHSLVVDGDFLHCFRYCTIIMQEGIASCETDGATHVSIPKGSFVYRATVRNKAE